ncbi:MAG: type I DNA topoisomerase [Salibacteraceae bacterium]
MNLVIVESPAKAKTIEGFLGKDFVVRSSYGHVRDLPTKGLSVDLEHDFQPKYEVLPDKKKVISELKELAKKADTVWLATDEDREGEAISWHLAEALKLDPKKTKRIVFHEITKPAIEEAIKKPRQIDKNLVDAQQARRILDRIVGFELSPVLWKKVKPALSAGRVQSVAVRLIVEREKEIDAFQSQSYYLIKALIENRGKTFYATYNQKLNSEKEVKALFDQLRAAEFFVEQVDKKPGKKSPAPPFTTSTLQQEAARKLGYSVAQTMRLAQSLYEAGKITYMRTDSVNLSNTAIEGAKNTILKEFGPEYVNPRKYSTKTANAQEAHEAIRPTYMDLQVASEDRREQRLYELIRKRTLASQMSDAKLLRTTISIAADKVEGRFEVKGEIITFDGFLKVYVESTDDESEEENASSLPDVNQGDQLKMLEAVATQRFTHHPPRYSEASLVKKLEELGIGRPSTYAPTISTIQKRGYVVKEDRPGTEREYKVIELKNGSLSESVKTEITGAERGKLFPTDIGIVVNDFLEDHFKEIMDYHFTASVEEQFDTISRGELSWVNMLKEFYKPFHHTVEETLSESERATGERLLGTDPKTGKPVYAKIGRYGPMVQIGEATDDEKPQFAKLNPGQSIQSITLDEAMELFKLPRKLGEVDGKEVIASIGRFGPYIRYGSAFISIGDRDPLELSLEEAREIIAQKQEQDKKAIIHEFDNDPVIKVLNGRYGPYISVGKENYRIPKGIKPEELTLEKCLEIISNTQPTGKGRKRKKS